MEYSEFVSPELKEGAKPIEITPKPYKEADNKLGGFPYGTKLSFAPLITHWEKLRSSDDLAVQLLGNRLFELLQESPELLEAIEDPTLLEKHKEIIDILVAGLVPSARVDEHLAFISNPFNPNGFYGTPAFLEMAAKKKEGFLMHKNPEVIKTYLTIRPGIEILKRIHGHDLYFDNPTVFSMQDPSTGLFKHYKSEMDLRFAEVKALGPVKKLGKKELNDILHNLFDLELWNKYVPADNFEFQGIVLVNMIDVTEEEAISQLKYILLEKDAVVKEESVNQIQEQLRTIFRIPDLKIGITALDCKQKSYSIYPHYLKNSFLSNITDNILDPAFKGSVYCKMCTSGQPVLVEDLKKSIHKTELESAIMEQGMRNILLTPLKDSTGEIIGALELGSTVVNNINSLVLLRLADILPMFNIAVERKREEVKNQIEAVIREQYTAVHPSVEWRFTETASKLINDRSVEGSNAKIEPIIFEDVYPLYGQVDIVGSSTIRNEAIRFDMTQNLDYALVFFNQAFAELKYPLIDQLMLKITNIKEDIADGIGSGDEARILDLLNSEVRPMIEQVKEKSQTLREASEEYYKQLDKDLKIVYDQRKDYEDSVSMINDMVGGCLDQAENFAQEMLPHYFEKYKTDGVEYNMYVGESLLNEEQFDYIHLKNFRLWQLMLMCEVTRKVDRLQPQLPTPLTTAQMVLVHNSPLNIRFRMDEKQFDVDGAYNVRYEILKKRVDKSVIENTGERLTVSGKIAIVYTQDKEEAEYETYLNYLVEKGHIEPNIERLRLAPLQGVSGLRALRVTVK